MQSLGLDRRFVLRFHTSVSWQPRPGANGGTQGGGTGGGGPQGGRGGGAAAAAAPAALPPAASSQQGQIHARAEVNVWSEVVGPFQAIPRPMLQVGHAAHLLLAIQSCCRPENRPRCSAAQQAQRARQHGSAACGSPFRACHAAAPLPHPFPAGKQDPARLCLPCGNRVPAGNGQRRAGRADAGAAAGVPAQGATAHGACSWGCCLQGSAQRLAAGGASVGSCWQGCRAAAPVPDGCWHDALLCAALAVPTAHGTAACRRLPTMGWQPAVPGAAGRRRSGADGAVAPVSSKNSLMVRPPWLLALLFVRNW